MNNTSVNPAPGFEKHPNHQVKITPFPDKVSVKHGDLLLAETSNALKVEESGYGTVYYIPGADLRMELFEPSTHSSFCPFKGHASYLNLLSAGGEGENITWGYEVPYDETAELKNHWAFYADRVEFDFG